VNYVYLIPYPTITTYLYYCPMAFSCFVRLSMQMPPASKLPTVNPQYKADVSFNTRVIGETDICLTSESLLPCIQYLYTD
jgi:hypothetical protein